MRSIQLNNRSNICLCHVGVIRGLRPRIVDAQKMKSCFYAAYARFFVDRLNCLSLNTFIMRCLQRLSCRLVLHIIKISSG